MAGRICRLMAPAQPLGGGISLDPHEFAPCESVDSIACSAGSIDSGSYYLGTGENRFERVAVRRDLTQLVTRAHRMQCPLIIGNAGFGGGDEGIAITITLLREVLHALGIHQTRIATIGSRLRDPKGHEAFTRDLLVHASRSEDVDPIGSRTSTVVAPIGIDPVIRVLSEGAQYIVAGYSCIAALFAADAVRRGVSLGIAYHVGHILQSGRGVCETGPSDTCLAAEFFDDDTAVIYALNSECRVTVHSIGRSSLYKQPHPYVTMLPDGQVRTESTQYAALDARSVQIQGSTFSSRVARAAIPPIGFSERGKAAPGERGGAE